MEVEEYRKSDKKFAKHCINNYYKRKKQYEIMTKKQREEEQARKWIKYLEVMRDYGKLKRT